MGHVCCMGMIMGLCLAFYVFSCKPVDIVERISLRACYFDGGIFFSKGIGMFITNNTSMGLYFEEVDGRW